MALFAAVAPAPALAAGTNTMYRLYNPNSGEHFYTANAGERDKVARTGWRYEGVGWTAPAKSNRPVYRLYSGTDHHYTASTADCPALADLSPLQRWNTSSVTTMNDMFRQCDALRDARAGGRSNAATRPYLLRNKLARRRPMVLHIHARRLQASAQRSAKGRQWTKGTL